MTRRYRRRKTRELIAVLVVAVLAVVRAVWWPDAPVGPESLESGEVSVERVIDGDTLRLASGARLRLQGVDTPEIAHEGMPAEPWAQEATQFTASFLEDAHGRVRVEFGPERKDQYGRFLAFVWHGDRLLNELLVREGLARATTHYHFSDGMKRRLRKAQSDAQNAARGIWSK